MGLGRDRTAQQMDEREVTAKTPPVMLLLPLLLPWEKPHATSGVTWARGHRICRVRKTTCKLRKKEDRIGSGVNTGTESMT